MKNLFKNLMLVAVAAMAFTACSQDVNEVNNVDRVTCYEFTANIADDTRSGFAGKNEAGDAYVSEWFGDETIKLFINDYNGYYVETTAKINAKGQFSVELTDAPESFFMTVVSPAESWSGEYSVNIPTEQTPLANSVDPKAHALQSSQTYITSDSANITMSPQNACYGKMTVNAPENFEIKKVEVSFNGGTVYTLNATHVDNNVFWFAVPSTYDVSEFTVTAYDAEGNAVARTVDVAAAGKTLKFQWGHVSTFSVSGLEAVVVPEEPSVKTFTSANVALDWDDEKYIAFNCDNGSLKKLQIDIANAFSFSSEGEILKEGTYSNMNPTSSGKIFTGTWSGSYYGEGEDMLYLTDITITVTHVEEGYHIVFENVTEYYDEYMLIESATYTGPITGLLTPDVSGESGESGEVAVPEFVIPGEGGVYDYDWRYTTLKYPLDHNNTMTVEKDNGWTWNIRFNVGLSSIEPGDYTAVQGFTTASALEVNTFDGAVQYGEGYTFFYPDSFSEVSINVQKEGEFYCITLIGANGFSAAGKTYRLVYIGKLK